MEIKIEKGFELPPRGRKAVSLTKEIKSSLLSMNVGESFVVKKISYVHHIQMWGRKVGKRFASRKIYTGERKDKNFTFRVWLEGDCKPVEPKPQKRDYTKNQPKSFGSLSKQATESVGEGSATERSKVPSEILSLAELREENRMIVDDINQIKKILKEELGYTDYTFNKNLWKDKREEL